MSKTQSAVTIGNFDGVHSGHQEIVKTLLSQAKPKGFKTIAITFDPHPTKILGGFEPPRLTSLEDKKNQLLALGVEEVLVLPFTKEFSQMPVREFVKTHLIENLQMKSLCIGSTTHVGNKREGTPAKLEELADELGFELVVAPNVSVAGELVSSSRIRAALKIGNLDAVTKMLGRFYSSQGRVVSGDQRGAKIGFPTANITSFDTLIPANGVYATRVEISGKWFQGVTNIGVRPTFHSKSPLVVEVHVLDVELDVREKWINLEWVARIRDEMKFAGVEALTKQIEKDIQEARGHLG